LSIILRNSLQWNSVTVFKHKRQWNFRHRRNSEMYAQYIRCWWKTNIGICITRVPTLFL